MLQHMGKVCKNIYYKMYAENINWLLGNSMNQVRVVIYFAVCNIEWFKRTAT